MSSKHLPILESSALAAAVVLTASLAALPTAGSTSGPNQEMRDGLSLLRGAIFRLELEIGAEEIKFIADSETLISQLTPRHLSTIPQNPVNQLATISVMPKHSGRPIFNEDTGWVYVPNSGEVRANLTGLDTQGTPYAEY